MLANKHFVSALIIAPLLALIGYFATDYYLAERARAAESGQSYRLLALPNCRHASGQCTLKNGDLTLVIKGREDATGRMSLELRANISIDSAQLAIVADHGLAVVDDGTAVEVVTASVASSPQSMRLLDDGSWWLALLPAPPPRILRLVVRREGVFYYAETAMPFLRYETSFRRDFRSPDNNKG
ncbi:hypothetical protein EDC56_0620 [Sinobacterium caligoides]|uniref:Uncharacterized protein n=1 Tax=Sinobacterium caligoides TaxID=933926 RepID=A0A3N2DYZ6_9GAMM|nr:hypothetical protein [Sinobacterium caligoides]ROS05096.1 hypothetical protein EDC56_0620 [Sinobacterium caligoides]